MSPAFFPVLRSCCARFAAILLMSALVQNAQSLAEARTLTGGFQTICQLHPYSGDNRTPQISGIAFDDQPNPWVIDGLSWQMQRLNENTGAVLQNYAPTPNTSYNNSLAWSSANHQFYTANNDYLYRVDIASNARALVGNITQSFNFMDLAFDAQGKLWLAADRNNGELWSVNTSTGAATKERSITGLGVNQQVHALAIDALGQFYVATSGSYTTTDNRIYNVSPQTGAATLVTSWATSGFDFLDKMAIDPSSGRWFGIWESRSGSSFQYNYVELNTVPEPSSFALLATAAIGSLAICWRRRNKDDSHQNQGV